MTEVRLNEGNSAMTLAPDRPSTLTLRRLGGRIGAVIEGIDVSQDLGDAVIHEIRAALVQHKAIVFRGQNLDDAAHQRFLARFGRLTTAHPPDFGHSVLIRWSPAR
jgi:taurine dioxygenase